MAHKNIHSCPCQIRFCVWGRCLRRRVIHCVCYIAGCTLHNYTTRATRARRIVCCGQICISSRHHHNNTRPPRFPQDARPGLGLAVEHLQPARAAIATKNRAHAQVTGVICTIGFLCLGATCAHKHRSTLEHIRVILTQLHMRTCSLLTLLVCFAKRSGWLKLSMKRSLRMRLQLCSNNINDVTHFTACV